MQVYELITELSKLPAGAEVEFSTVMTVSDIANLEVLNDDKDVCRITVKIKDVDQISSMLVALHG